jgi:hypothetical protein
VSEYQYYEFRAVDRPLSEQELSTLHALSTRAEITSTSFTNTYSWGDFKGNPDSLMEKCFDAFVYLANWGSRRFILRLPGKRHFKALSVYSRGESVRTRRAGEFVIVELHAEEVDGDWIEGEGWMASLIPLRADLLRQDYRCLYLGWLRSVQDGDFDDDDSEPPVPPGLRNLTGPLQALVDFLRIDNDLVEAAAKASDAMDTGPTRDDLAAWLRQMPETEKDALLIDAALKDNINFQAELLRRYADHRPIAKAVGVTPTARRTVGELLLAADECEKQRTRRERERKAAEQARQAKKDAEQRARYLDQLAEREQTVWSEVTELIRTKRPTEYTRAVNLLVDLRDLAERRSEGDVFSAAIRSIREIHTSRPALLRRLNEAKL